MARWSLQKQGVTNKTTTPVSHVVQKISLIYVPNSVSRGSGWPQYMINANRCTLHSVNNVSDLWVLDESLTTPHNLKV